MSLTWFAGIDPGKSGALALLSPLGDVKIWDTPTLVVKKDSSRQAYDEAAMCDLLRALPDGVRLGIEVQHAMPKQGVSSMFSLGDGYGLWRGMLTALGISYVLVQPQRWKKALMDGQPKDKAASVLVASRLWPAHAQVFRGPKGAAKDGRADAVLIAEYVRRLG